MSQDLEAMKKELQRLKKQRAIDAKALERARARTLTDPSNRSFAANLAEDLKRLDKSIAALQAEIEKAGGGL